MLVTNRFQRGLSTRGFDLPQAGLGHQRSDRRQGHGQGGVGQQTCSLVGRHGQYQLKIFAVVQRVFQRRSPDPPAAI